jgi:Ca-activated chloride channel homolog
MKILAVTIILMAIALGAFSQDGIDRVETNLVTLNVSVVDGRGKPVKGLNTNNFLVFDNGRPQNIEFLSLHDAPVSVGVIYDIHRAEEEHTRNIIAALRSFSSSLGREDDLFVNVIGERGSLTTEFVPTEQQIRDNVVNAEKRGKNSLYDAIFEASKKLATARNSKRFLILVTDGADRNSHHTLRELRSHFRSINLPVYSITFGGNDRRQFGYSDIHREVPIRSFGLGETNELDRAIVSELSHSSGGQTFEAEVRNRFYLTALFSRVFGEVRSQYVLGFYPEKVDGKYHKLKVAIEGKKARGLKLTSRSGYQSRRSS